MRKSRTERRTSSPPPSLSLACLQAGDLKNRGRPRGNVAKSYRRARFLTGDWDSRGVVSPRGVNLIRFAHKAANDQAREHARGLIYPGGDRQAQSAVPARSSLAAI